MRLDNQLRIKKCEEMNRSITSQQEKLKHPLDNAIGGLAHKVGYLEQRGSLSDSSLVSTNSPEVDETSTMDAKRHFSNVKYDTDTGGDCTLNEQINDYAARMMEQPSA